MSNSRNIAHLLGQNHDATRMIDSADVLNLTGDFAGRNMRIMPPFDT